MSNIVYAPGSPMAGVIAQCDLVAATDAAVLLHGEGGTGKERLARLVHAASKRSGAFVAVSCGAVAGDLVDAELFGSSAGGKGRLDAAQGGTLFLDEIDALPLAAQVKLLGFLQDHRYERAGDAGAAVVTADVRIVAGTSKDLVRDVEAGRFRRDLFYRLTGCPIEIPPLRARDNDIEVLFLHFWSARGETRPVDDAVIAHLRAYWWPGNVRELENVVERLALSSQDAALTEMDLPVRYRARPSSPAPIELPELPAPTPGALKPMNLAGLLRGIEGAYIDAALVQTSGNRQAAASLLGLQRTTLVEKLRRRQTASAPLAAS